MPGGWTMSMVWMNMPDQSWGAATSVFLGMWVVMMLAMMLPSLVPTLLGYRRSFQGLGRGRLAWLTAAASAGYFLVWAVLGMVAYALGVTLVAAEMKWLPLARHVPHATAVALLLAGSFQLTAWKAGRLAKCRNVQTCNSSLASKAQNAFRHGLVWGVDCVFCCLGFMTVLLLTGVMNLITMIALSVGITAERLMPRPDYASKFAGIVIISAAAASLVEALGK